MKIVAAFIIGVLVTVPAMLVLDFLYPSDMDLSIVINISNDTENAVDYVNIETDDGQRFSCTLRFNRCSIALLHTGDISFKVSAHLQSGEVRTGYVGYSDPGSTENILIGSLVVENS
jgi:hypothetical protein